jgi:hypothetical protein
MTDALKNYVKAFDDVLSPEQCRSFIELFESCPAVHVEFSRQRCPNFVQAELKALVSASGAFADAQEQMLAGLKGLLAKYCRELPVRQFQFPDRFTVEAVRVKKYRVGVGDAFDLHTDVSDHASARRFLAFLIYLNDVEEGGETIFPDIGIRMAPKAGSALVFPPLWMWRHEGCTPLSGPKYIASSYLHYL